MKTEELNQEKIVAFIYRMKAARAGGNVNRFHTMTTLCKNTVAQHSFGVAVMMDQMYDGKAPAHMLRAALYHDIAEAQFGDIPSPAKRAMDSADLRLAEDKYMKSNGLWTELNDWERWQLKSLDILDGLWYCAEEMGLGNRRIVEAWNNYRSYLFDHVKNAEPFMGREHYNEALDFIGAISGSLQAEMEHYLGH